MRHEESLNFARDEVRATVIPTYMGLIKQIDDHLGRLWQFLEERRLFERTMIVMTSDHGDYLGDHWLGEKELFHEESVRIPLIVYDPDAAANATRGSQHGGLVEAIDLLPTFIEAAGGTAPGHVLEGHSLLPVIRGGAGPARDAVFSECDYAFRAARLELAVAPAEARAYMVRTERWKYVLYEGFRPQLFDLAADPRERRDLGADPQLESVRRALDERLFAWARHRRSRVTISDAEIERRTNTHKQRGFPFGVW
jgi:arylsulfatase A-like enzyme